MTIELGVAAMVAAGVWALCARLLRRERIHDWERILAEVGLTGVEREGHPGLGEQIVGRAGELALRFEPDGARLRVFVSDLLTDLVFEAGRSSAPDGPSFDLRGPDDLVDAFQEALSYRARRVLRSTPAVSSLVLENGTLTATLDVDAHEPSSRPLETALPELHELAALLSPGADGAERLFALFRGEDDPRVRGSLLRLLSRSHAGHAAARAACETGLQDKHPWVRLEAAIGLGEAGLPTLRSLATGRALNDADTARAIETLRAHLTVQDVASALGRARKGRNKGRRHATVRACIEALGGMGVPALRPLAGLVRDADAAVAAQAADALGATGCPEAEPALLAALERPEDPVRTAAVRGLAQVGTGAAILPLRTAEDARGALGPAAAAAIAAILARTGVSAGLVTLAEPDGGGRVSLSEDPAGRVSVRPAGPRDGEG